VCNKRSKVEYAKKRGNWGTGSISRASSRMNIKVVEAPAKLYHGELVRPKDDEEINYGNSNGRL